MAIKRPWGSLAVSGDLPLLFLKVDADLQRCAFQLTDLNRLWGVTLGRTDLVKSANDQLTSIDPGEDDEQYEQFFNKVNSALGGSGKTTCKVQPGSSADALQLSVSAPLPGFLPTFNWSVELRRLDNDSGVAFESELLTPFLAYTHSLRSQINQLIEEIGHKDRIISKITDKLETSGNDLSQVFPGVSNIRVHRKSSQRAQLASYINGLAEFDQQEWRLQAAKAALNLEPSIDDVDSLLHDLPEASLLSAHKDPTGIWWHSTHVINGAGQDSDDGDDSRSRNDISGREMPSKQPTPSFYPAKSMKEGNGFQRPTTPAIHKHRNGEPHVNETDEDYGGDLDAPSQRASGRAKTASQRASTSGKTLSQSEDCPRSHGHEAPNSATRSPGLGVADTREAKPPAADSETASESGGDHETTSRASPQPGHSSDATASKAIVDAAPLAVHDDGLEKWITETYSPAGVQSSPTTKKTKRLGAVGGKKKPATLDISQHDHAEDTNNADKYAPGSADVGSRRLKAKRLREFGKRQPEAPAAPPLSIEEQSSVSLPPRHIHHKLGNFSGRKSKSPPPIEQEPKDERPPPTVEREEEVEKEREDPEERANKKRERLKRELEAKSKAPVKKKRKF